MNQQDKTTVLKNFQASFLQFHLSIKLDNDHALYCTIINYQNLQYFEERIDTCCVENQPSLDGIFDTPQSIFDYISSHFNKLAIQSTGVIRFNEKKTKQGDKLGIPITKIDKYKFQILWSKILQMKSQLDQDIALNQRNDLKRDKDIKKQLENIKNINIAQNQQIQSINSKILIFQAQEKTQDTKIKELEQINSAQNEKIQDIERRLSELLTNISLQRNKNTQLAQQISALEIKCNNSNNCDAKSSQSFDLEELRSKIEKIQNQTNISILSIKQADQKLFIKQENLQFKYSQLQKSIGQLKHSEIEIRNQLEAFHASSLAITSKIVQLQLKDTACQRQRLGYESRIDILEKQQPQIHKQFEELRSKIMNLDRTNELNVVKEGQFSSKISQMKQNISETNNRLESFIQVKSTQLERSVIISNEKIQSLVDKNQEYLSALNSVEHQLDELKHNISDEKQKHHRRTNNYGHHHDNPHRQHFALIKNSGISLKINRISASKYYNFVNKQQIISSTYTYKVKLTSITLRNLYIGFCIKEILETENIIDNSIYYYCGTGCINNFGTQHKTNIKSENEDEIHTTVDYAHSNITWKKNGEIFAQTKLPENIAKKPLFFALRFFYHGDEVQILY